MTETAPEIAEDFADHPLRLTNDQVALLSPAERTARVHALVAWSYWLLDMVIAKETTDLGKTLVGVCVLYSGGNDSTTMAHLFKDKVTHAVHCNTGIGIEATRQFVRDTCVDWGIPLMEEHPPEGSTFRDLVLDQGFPGPAHHYKMYQRLKERGLMSARRRLVTHSRRERVIYLAGRRRDESARRQSIPSHERRGSIVYVSPMIFWTKLDMNTYRAMAGDVPHNPVTDMLHMSGECLCGSFAHENELDEIGQWMPEVKHEIEHLEAEVLATGKFPEWQCEWGWGANKDAIKAARKSGMSDDEITALFSRKSGGLMCSSCDARAAGLDMEVVVRPQEV